MRTDDVFNDIDSRTADRLAKEYPVLRDEQKERLYAMSKRKFDIKIDNSSIDVSGVEKYRRPKWFKGVSVAAAALLLVAGIGGSMYYISRSGWRASVEIVGTLAETTEVTTEALTEEQTEAEEADAVAKALIDDYREFMCVLYGGDLEVDKSDTITRAITIPDNDVTFDREFYRVTDTRYPTWADIEKRCYEILDTELAEKILEISTVNKEDFYGCPFIHVEEDGYYIEVGIHDNGIDPLSTSEYDMNAYTDDSGNIIATIVETELREVHDYPVPETTFTIVNTENGWRISDVTEKPLNGSIEDSTDADAIAKELTNDWMECLFDIHGRTLEVDRSSVVTKTIKFDDGSEFTRDFYRVIDPRYPTWEDLEKRCYEVCDAELGKIVLDACACAREEDIDYTTLIFTTDDGYYVNTETCDTSDRLYKWIDDEVKGEFDENGNIITTRSHIDLDIDPNRTYKTKFTIVKTESGWRISKAEEE